jgi:hypothetical protein
MRRAPYSFILVVNKLSVSARVWEWVCVGVFTKYRISTPLAIKPPLWQVIIPLECARVACKAKHIAGLSSWLSNTHKWYTHTHWRYTYAHAHTTLTYTHTLICLPCSSQISATAKAQIQPISLWLSYHFLPLLYFLIRLLYMSEWVSEWVWVRVCGWVCVRVQGSIPLKNSSLISLLARKRAISLRWFWTYL